MVFGMFSNKNQLKSVDSKITVFSNKISDAFLRIRDDITSSDQRLQATEDELAKINRWIGYLYQSQQQIHNNHTNLSEKQHQLTSHHTKLTKSHETLSKSVDLKHSQVKHDISGTHTLTNKEIENIREWVRHFSEKLEGQKDIEYRLKKDVSVLQSNLTEAMTELKDEVTTLKSENAELREKLVELSNAEPKVIEKVVEIEKKVELPATISPSLPAIKEETPQYVPAQIPAHNKFEQHILSRVRPNRKNFVMQNVLDLIQDNKYSTKEVEEIIVSEKQLCGRTSFYSYLRELKHRGKINYADLGDKTILVMTKTQ